LKWLLVLDVLARNWRKKKMPNCHYDDTTLTEEEVRKLSRLKRKNAVVEYVEELLTKAYNEGVDDVIEDPAGFGVEFEYEDPYGGI